jgi:sulfate permease, SulP family
LTRFRINVLDASNLRGDIFGGLTAAVVALPLAIAFGVASGAGAVAGLYGAACVGLFAALFGGTPAQISGPTGPMTIVSASVFTLYADNPSVAFTVVMMAGGFQVLFGAMRLGRYVNLMPYPVISGFMTGIGVILIIMQLEPLLGYPSPNNVVNAITVLPNEVLHANWQAVVLGVISLCICLFTPAKLNRIAPAPLIALIVASLLAFFLPDVAVLGVIPTGLPELRLPTFLLDDLDGMLVSAAVLGALGAIDSLLTSLAADNVTRTFHDSDKELVGQGLGNLVAGIFGGLPGAGATIRTLTNVKAGGRTPLSGVLHAIIVLLVVLGLGPVLAYIPNAALAGILIKVGLDVIDWRFLKRMLRAPRIDVVLMAVVLVLTVLIDVITAVAAGVVMASLVFVKESADLQIESIQALSDPDHAPFLSPEEAALFRRCEGRLLILYLSGLMSFGAAKELSRRIGMTATFDVVLIDLHDVPKVDGSAALALEEIVDQSVSAGQDVLMVGLSAPVARLLGQMGILERFKETTRFVTRREALRYAAEQRHQPAGSADTD